MAGTVCSRRAHTALFRDASFFSRFVPTLDTSRNYATHKNLSHQSQKQKKSQHFPDDFYIPFDPTPLSKITAEQAGPSAAAPTPTPFHATLPQGRNDVADESTLWVTRGSQTRQDEEPQTSLVLDGKLKGMSGDGLQRVIERDFFFDSSRLPYGFTGLQPKASSVVPGSEEAEAEAEEVQKEKKTYPKKQPGYGSRKAAIRAKTKPSGVNRQERLLKWKQEVGIPIPDPAIEVETTPPAPSTKPPKAKAKKPRSEKASSAKPTKTKTSISTKTTPDPTPAPNPYTPTTPSTPRPFKPNTLPLPQSQSPTTPSTPPSTAWLPTRRLSPDALDGVRALHTQYPTTFTIPVLSAHFNIGREAIQRILKSKWRANASEQEERRERWDRRGARIWTKLVERGEHAPRKWREMGIGGGPRGGERRREWVREKMGKDGGWSAVKRRERVDEGVGFEGEMDGVEGVGLGSDEEEIMRSQASGMVVRRGIVAKAA